MTVFNHHCTVPDQMKLANYGKRWTDDEVDKLAMHLRVGASMNSICVQMQRPADGVLAKAKQYNFITEDEDGEYHINPAALTIRDNKNWRAHGKSAMFAAAYGASAKTINNHMLQGTVYDRIIFDELNKEPAMTQKNIETKTFIQGVDASTLSDAQIFTKIEQLQAEQKRLEGINHSAQSKKLGSVLDQLYADIKALTAYVDAR